MPTSTGRERKNSSKRGRTKDGESGSQKESQDTWSQLKAEKQGSSKSPDSPLTLSKVKGRQFDRPTVLKTKDGRVIPIKALSKKLSVGQKPMKSRFPTGMKKELSVKIMETSRSSSEMTPINTNSRRDKIDRLVRRPESAQIAAG